MKESGRASLNTWRSKKRGQYPELEEALKGKASMKTWDPGKAITDGLHLWQAHYALYGAYQFKARKRKVAPMSSTFSPPVVHSLLQSASPF